MIRTRDLLIRSQTLYPAELHSHIRFEQKLSYSNITEMSRGFYEENKKLIIDISLLSSGQRIGNIAENELGMHKAEGDEIIRVEMEKRK